MSRGRENFLVELSDWLRNTHPNAKPMATKTIGDHLRENGERPGSSAGTWLRAKIISLSRLLRLSCSEINFGRKTLYRNRNKRPLLQDRAGHSTRLRKVPDVVATKSG